MKRTNYRRYIRRLHDITGYAQSEIAKLLYLLDWNVNTLIEIIETVKNSKDLTLLPISPKGVNEVIGTEYWRIHIDLRNFFDDKKPIYVTWNKKSMFKPTEPKKNNVKPLKYIHFKNTNGTIKNDKRSRKAFHDNQYPVNYEAKEKQPITQKKKKKISNQKLFKGEKTIKYKDKPHTTQSKLVCIMDYNSKEIIRIRKSEVENETKKRKWKKWDYVSKTAFKTQELRYKIGETYEKNKHDKELISKVFPFKNMFSRIIKIDLLRAFFNKKDDIVKDKSLEDKIKSRVIEIIQKRGKNKLPRIEKQTVIEYEKKIKKYKSKDYKKKRWITIDKLINIKVNKRIPDGFDKIKKNKLIKQRIEKTDTDGKKYYKNKKVLTEITVKVPKFKIIETTKKKKIRKLIEKKMITIKGKITKIRIPKFVTATRCIASVYDLAKRKYTIREECTKINEDGKTIAKIIKK